MNADYMATVPPAIVAHGQACMYDPSPVVSGAYLTGTVIGQAEGKQAVQDALETDAQHRAESFAADLGARPEYPWEKPRWDRRRLQGQAPENLTGNWRPKAQPTVDDSGDWTVLVPPTHEPAHLAAVA